MFKRIQNWQARRREIERHAALWELMEAGKVVCWAGDQVAVKRSRAQSKDPWIAEVYGGEITLHGHTAELWRDKLRREGQLG